MPLIQGRDRKIKTRLSQMETYQEEIDVQLNTIKLELINKLTHGNVIDDIDEKSPPILVTWDASKLPNSKI